MAFTQIVATDVVKFIMVATRNIDSKYMHYYLFYLFWPHNFVDINYLSKAWNFIMAC
jgi:hypothetical protein